MKLKMNILTDIFRIGCLLALWGMMIFIYTYGASHAFEKHGMFSGMLNLLFPPAAVYYTAEGLIWHDDFDNVDWVSKIKIDQHNIYYLLLGSSQYIDPTQKIALSKAIQSYSDQIKNYPEEQKSRLKSFAKDNINYYSEIQKNMSQTLRKSHEQKEWATFKKSENLLIAENNLLQNYPHLQEIVDGINFDLEALNLRFSSVDFNFPNEDSIKKIQLLEDNLDLNIRNTKKAYSELFKVSF